LKRFFLLNLSKQLSNTKTLVGYRYNTAMI